MTDFTMKAGDSKTLQVTVRDTDGNVVDITGVTIKWQLAKRVSGPALVSKQTGSGIVITNGSSGRFDVSLDPSDTLELSGIHYYEAEINDSGIKSTVLSGTVRIEKALIQ